MLGILLSMRRSRPRLLTVIKDCQSYPTIQVVISHLERSVFKHILWNPKLGRKSRASGDAHQLGLDNVLAKVAFGARKA